MGRMSAYAPDSAEQQWIDNHLSQAPELTGEQIIALRFLLSPESDVPGTAQTPLRSTRHAGRSG